MPAFAAWIGRMAAAFAALLAAIWFFEAMPYSAAEASRLSLECRRAALQNLPPGLALAEARACETRFTQWNEALTTRALLAAGAAVVLVLLTAMIPATPRRRE